MLRRGQTGKHLCRQQCVRNNVSSFARALKGNKIKIQEKQDLWPSLSSLIGINYFTSFENDVENVKEIKDIFRLD